MFGCTSVDLTVEQALIRRLYKRRINDCTSVESTIVQASNQRWHKCWLNGCVSVESMILQASNQWLHFWCPLSATVFKKGSEFFKEYFIYKEKSGASKLERSTKNSRSMIYQSFILELFIMILQKQPPEVFWKKRCS